jgi:hypothetical protein
MCAAQRELERITTQETSVTRSRAQTSTFESEMNQNVNYPLAALLRWSTIITVAVSAMFGQTLINLANQGQNVDFTNQPWTRPIKAGTAPPPTCSIGDLFFLTNAQPGQNLYACPATNSWTVLGSSSSSGSNLASGPLAKIPSTCTPGSGIYLFFAIDQPAGQQEYQCSATNIWTQLNSLGGSGALVMTGGSLDINTAVISRIAAAENITGVKIFNAPFALATTGSSYACSSATRGYFFMVQGNGTTTGDSLQVCVLGANGTYSWKIVF